VLLWWLVESDRLTKPARHAINTADEVAVSVASVWELSLKVARGTLEIPNDLEEQLERNAFRVLTVTMEHAIASTKLPKHHRDPFDRMFIAQAQMESLTLLTADRRHASYGVSVMLV
jgi:PIN domain nuclease of toxin-antitoxin system